MRLNDPQQILRNAAICDTVCSVWPALVSVSFDACATFAIATFTCSTAVVCCLVDSSISRAASVVVVTRPAICLNADGHFAELPDPASTALEPLSVAITVVLTALRTSSMSVADLLGRAADPVGQLADLVGDHREPLAGFAGAGRLDGRVDREDVGLLGELGDDIEHGADLLRLLAELQHVGDDLIHLAPDAGDRLVRHVDGAVARARGARRLLGDLRHPLRALGDLARGREQLADRRGDFGHGGRLLLCAGRLLIGRRLKLGRGALDVADRGADLPRQRSRDEPTDRPHHERAERGRPR